MPNPKPGEERDDYMERCMRDGKMNKQFPDSKQRYAVCVRYYDESPEASEETMDAADELWESIIEASHEGSVVLDEATVEALQYGRPGKNDPRKTPAKPSERRKGSKKNKPGSAKKPNKSIQVSKGTESRLRKLMSEHNAKVKKKGKGSRAGMGALKSVFRRGAGAFSRSHAPGMGRTGWGIARVKAFLYLLRNGRPSNPNYKQDNDLLPKGHPRAKKATVDEDEEVSDFVILSASSMYQGKKVTLNKPFRTPKGPKKFSVYVKNERDNVVKVNFGDPNMEIKRDDPARRKSFRSRHNCDNPGPKTKARYWSCKMWERSKTVTEYTSSEDLENQIAELLSED